MDFEKAIRYRDYLDAIQYIIAKSQVIDYMKDNKSIAAIEYLNDTMFKFFLIKGNTILFKETYKITYLNSEIISNILKRNIKHYFNNLPHTTMEIGPEEINESQIIYGYLNSENNKLKSVVILESWLKDNDDIALDKELNNLLINSLAAKNT